MGEQTLGHKERMVRVIAHHSSTEDQPMSPSTAEQLSGTAGREALGRQADGITHRSAQNDSSKFVAQAEFSNHRPSEGYPVPSRRPCSESYPQPSQD